MNRVTKYLMPCQKTVFDIIAGYKKRGATGREVYDRRNSKKCEEKKKCSRHFSPSPCRRKTREKKA